MREEDNLNTNLSEKFNDQNISKFYQVVKLLNQAYVEEKSQLYGVDLSSDEETVNLPKVPAVKESLCLGRKRSNDFDTSSPSTPFGPFGSSGLLNKEGSSPPAKNLTVTRNPFKAQLKASLKSRPLVDISIKLV